MMSPRAELVSSKVQAQGQRTGTTDNGQGKGARDRGKDRNNGQETGTGAGTTDNGQERIPCSIQVARDITTSHQGQKQESKRKPGTSRDQAQKTEFIRRNRRKPFVSVSLLSGAQSN